MSCHRIRQGLRAILPNAPDTVRGKTLLIRHEGLAIKHGLRDQHPVEGILERAGHCSGCLPVGKRYRQRDEVLRIKHGRKVANNGRDPRELPDPEFRGDFPG